MSNADRIVSGSASGASQTPQWLLAFALAVGVLVRLSVFAWSTPWEPHHPDEHTLPVEALALWEGITPYEVGWPASTTRLILSASAGVQWLITQGLEAWAVRDDPGAVLNQVTAWIGTRYADPEPLYQLGRTVSIVTGILQLLAVVWAVRQWTTGRLGVQAAALTAALAPIAVAYSQYVVADITGLLFATLCVGLAAHPTRGRILGMSALAALAACSKFHFGIWLLAPLLCVWLSSEPRIGNRVGLSALVLALAGWIFVTLVPWAWTNPLLTAKEFAHVVLSKVGAGAAAPSVWANARLVLGGLGMLCWAGAAVGLLSLRPVDLRRVAPAALPTLLGLIALSFSAVPFDRHGLVLAPGMFVLGAIGWERVMESRTRAVRWAAVTAFAVCALVTSTSLVRVMRVSGESDVDTLVKQWILDNVPQGRRVAVQDEMTAFLPRVPDQLRDCADSIFSRESFAARSTLLGLTGSADEQAVWSAVMNDQVFQAFRCRRELQVHKGGGYRLVFFHQDERFGSLLESQVIEEFFSGSTAHSGGIDVLVLNRALNRPEPPSILVKTLRGQRAIYARERSDPRAAP